MRSVGFDILSANGYLPPMRDMFRAKGAEFVFNANPSEWCLSRCSFCVADSFSQMLSLKLFLSTTELKTKRLFRTLAPYHSLPYPLLSSSCSPPVSNFLRNSTLFSSPSTRKPTAVFNTHPTKRQIKSSHLRRLDASFDSPDWSGRPQMKKKKKAPLGPSSPVSPGTPSRHSRIPASVAFVE